MAAVSVTSVNILNNPAPFAAPLQFEIQYECVCDLQHDLEWRITYVGSADSEEYDQVLDSVLVGPVGPGQYKFVLQTDAPDASKLPQDDIVGVTVVLLTCLYQDKEFLRIGYYVNTDYPDQETRENPPQTLQVERLFRSLLADKPRVTRFPIEWDQPEQVPTMGGSEQQAPQNYGQFTSDGFPEPSGLQLDQEAYEPMEEKSNSMPFAQQQASQNGLFPSMHVTAQAGHIDYGGAMEE